MTNRFNKHDFIENQAKLDIFGNFFDILERSLMKAQSVIVVFKVTKSDNVSQASNMQILVTV
jgi:hypothetical protein